MNKSKDPKTSVIYLRVTADMNRRFKAAASRYGYPSDVLRDLIRGFIEGRVTVNPPLTKKESLYHVTRNED
jgi:hypothetical protein